MTHHQYGISAHVSQTSFGGETSGSVAKCWLFSQAIFSINIPWKTIQFFIFTVINQLNAAGFILNYIHDESFITIINTYICNVSIFC